MGNLYYSVALKIEIKSNIYSSILIHHRGCTVKGNDLVKRVEKIKVQAERKRVYIGQSDKLLSDVMRAANLTN